MMNQCMKLGAALLFTSALAACSGRSSLTLSVQNGSAADRMEEMVEIPLKSLSDLKLKEGEHMVLSAADGKEVPYQITHDSLLIFPVTVKAGQTAELKLAKGEPQKVDTVSCGHYYVERDDDIAWENDKAAYRAYGPALQKRGEKGFGYDVFTKNVPYPVLRERYKRELNPEAWKEIHRLQAEGKKAQADSLIHIISYHVDHGNGMDCYSVGPTLGGGTAALLQDTTIVYPWCYKDYAILDNGPLRFTVKLVFHREKVGQDSVQETRLISLDKGSYLNRTRITYDGLSKPTTVAAGIVLHPQNPDGYAYSVEDSYIAYADSTDNVNNHNGVMFMGVVEPTMKKAHVQWFGEEEKKERPGALGHVLGETTYQPGDTYIYYWGSGWSKADVPDMDAWKKILKDFSLRVKQPLKVTVK